jgi:hypothetical protein
VEETFAGVGSGLDVRVVEGGCTWVRARECLRVGSHAGGDEVAKAVRGPGKVVAKRLEDEERFVEFAAPLDGAVEGEVVGGAAGGDHPVENVAAVGINGRAITKLDAD